MPDPLPQLAQAISALHFHLRQAVVASRGAQPDFAALSRVEKITSADTLYAIDRVTEEALFAWFETHWPMDQPVEVIVEGAEPRCFPEQASPQWKCLIDPIDGTRHLMFDKRPAWIITALAPNRGESTMLGDAVLAALTEIPTSKQVWSDHYLATRGCGREGIHAESHHLENGATRPVAIRPSNADHVVGGFAAISRFFPEGKAWFAGIESRLWEAVLPKEGPDPMLFEDQYASTGGQFQQLLTGRDRMLADLRPLYFRKFRRDKALACHPYDAGAALLLKEAGCVLLNPDGTEFDAPFDTTSPVAWVGYANAKIAERIQPALERILREEGALC